MRKQDSQEIDRQARPRRLRLSVVIATLTMMTMTLVGGLVVPAGASAARYVLEDWDGSPPVGSWKTNADLDFKGWESFVSDPSSLSTSQAPTIWEGRGLYGHSGLSILAGPGTAEWRWEAPGTSTIFKAEYPPATFNLLGCMNEGLRKADGYWQPSTNARPDEAQDGSYHPTACGAGVLVPPLANAQVIIGNPGRQIFCSNTSDTCSRLESPIGNSAVFGIQRIGLAQLWFSGYLPGAKLYVTDYDKPTFSGATNSLTTWVKDGVGQISATAIDTGLGVKAIRLSAPSRSGGRDQQTKTHPCQGDRNDRCPATWNAERPSYVLTFSYNVDDLPEGINHFGLKASDIVENKSLPGEEDDLQVVPVTKVDRSAPTNVNATGELADLHDQYINGQGAKTVTAAAQDPAAADGQRLSGITRRALEDIGHGVIVQADVACDPDHDQCPVDASESLTVDTSQLSEGKHELRVVATDLAGNTMTSDPWTVYVDRTGPTMDGTIDTILDEGDGIADLDWDPVIDPALPTGEAGVGFSRYEVRARPEGGNWTAYGTINPTVYPTVELGPHQVGDRVEYEIKAYDALGNVSVFTATAGVELTDVTAGDDGDFAPGEEQQPDGAPDVGEGEQWRDVDPDGEMDAPAPEDGATGSVMPQAAPTGGSLFAPPGSATTASSSDYDTQLCSRDGNSSPCGTYSGRTAAAYARRWAKTNGGADRNHDYTYYDSDCTNFASRVLHFGNMHFMRTHPGINDPRHDENEYYIKGPGSWWSEKYTNTFGKTRYRNSTSWSVGWVLYNQLVNHGLARVVTSPERLHSGDILFHWWKGRTQIDDIDHVNVVAGVRKRQVYIAQHAQDRWMTLRKWSALARKDHPRLAWVVLRPVATRFDLP